MWLGKIVLDALALGYPFRAPVRGSSICDRSEAIIDGWSCSKAVLQTKRAKKIADRPWAIVLTIIGIASIILSYWHPGVVLSQKSNPAGSMQLPVCSNGQVCWLAVTFALFLPLFGLAALIGGLVWFVLPIVLRSPELEIRLFGDEENHPN